MWQMEELTVLYAQLTVIYVADGGLTVSYAQLTVIYDAGGGLTV